MAPAKFDLDKATLPAGDTAAESTGAPTMFALTIQYHPDLERIGERALLPELSAGKPALLSRAAPLFSLPGGGGAAEPLGDEHLSRKPLRLVRVEGGVRLEIGQSGTAVKVGGDLVQGESTFTALQIHRGVVLELAHRVVLLLHLSAAACWSTTVKNLLGPDEDQIIGESDELYRMLCNAHSLADLDVPVLLRGETGTGKEVMARVIHRRSARCERPFVTVNLAAIPPSIMIAELFGAEHGSFTGSRKRQSGYFERAHGGMLFLDEIGEAPVELQVALLRALESGEIQPVGAQSVRKVDVRVLAATDAPLENMVADGTFRAPLLHRLAQCPLRITPLRERRDDIGRFLKVFLKVAARSIHQEHRLRTPVGAEKPWFPARLAARLCEQDWSGNVRQLHNVVRSLVVASQDLPVVTDAPLGALLTDPVRTRVGLGAPPPAPAGGVEPTELPGKPASPRGRAARKTASVTERELEAALRACNGSRAGAARLLGISPATVYKLTEGAPQLRPAGALRLDEIEEMARACGGDTGKMAERFGISQKALKRRMTALGMTRA